MVVLDEFGIDTMLPEALLVIVLDEEAALIAEELRVDQEYPFQAGRVNFDIQPGYASLSACSRSRSASRR